MKKSRTLGENAKEWQTHVESYMKSGVSQREYCRQHGISYWSFNTWKRKIETGSNKLKLQEVSKDLVHSLSAEKGIEFVLGDRIRITIPDNFSEETLKKILNILGIVR
jgi:hypothetical protein